MINMVIKESEITGVMIQYYKVCTRELWFYINQVNMNYDNDDIDIGKLIHENSYKREKKEIKLDNLVFDFIQTKNELIIYEVKKSSKLTIGGLYQLYFYLWILNKANIHATGYLVYPKEKKKEKIELTEDIISEMEMIIKEIKKISNLEKPPLSHQQPYCKKCTYYELCMI